jgi:hypothetical protein
MELDGN